ncbi:hypothetical protein Tco_0018731 [Tanacetum coccineum]
MSDFDGDLKVMVVLVGWSSKAEGRGREVFDEVLRLLLVDAGSDGGVTSLTISLPLFLVVACVLVDGVCLDDGAWVF